MKAKKISENTIEVDGVLYDKRDSKGWLDVSDVLGEGYEVEIEVHDKNKSWDDLGLKYGDERLLNSEQVTKLANSKHAKILKMDGSSSEDDFFIDQPFEFNKEKGYVAWFYAYSDYVILGACRNSDGSNSNLGVRFVRKVSNKSTKKS